MNFIDYTYDRLPSAGLSYPYQWGMDQRDEIEIKREHQGDKLSAVFIKNESQIDQCWLMGPGWQEAGEATLLAFAHPVLAIPEGRSNLYVRPSQFFGGFQGATVATAGKYYDAPQGSATTDPYSFTQQFVDAYRGQLYGRHGGFISLRAYYGKDYPRSYPRKRSNFQRSHGLTAARGNLPPVDAGAPVYGTVFRNIIVGRNYWKMVGVNSSGSMDAFFLWRIYGCTGWKGELETRVLLASGTGVSTLIYQGTTGYDAIELDAAKNNGAGGTGVANIRFEARD